MPEFDNLRLEIADNIATITMNREDTRNALSYGMASDITAALDLLGQARVLVLTGAGKGFCSGGDLSMFARAGSDLGQGLHDGLSNDINPMILKLAALDIPVITRVNGAAAGAGAPLALMGDFTVAGHSAFFYFAFANVGLALDAGSSWLLPRLVGKARSMELLMLAERLPAQTAQEWGLIYKAVADDMLDGETATLAQRLANGPTRSYSLIRKAVLAGFDSDLPTALATEADAQREAGNSRDCVEAVKAFLGKRPPEFKGH